MNLIDGIALSSRVRNRFLQRLDFFPDRLGFMLEPMDIDTEVPRKSMGLPDRRSRGKSRGSSISGHPGIPKTPATTLKQEMGTQTRRIVKVRRDGDFSRTNVDRNITPPQGTGVKRKFGSTPDDNPMSPGLGGNRTKLRRIAESPIRLRGSSIAGPNRKSKTNRNSNRPSAAPAPRKSTARPSVAPGLGLESMTVRQLKNLLMTAGVDTSDCLEKSELIERATRHGLSNSVVSRPSVSAKSTPVMEPAPISAPSVAVTTGAVQKRHSRKHSGVKVSQTALMEIGRIEEVSAKPNATCFDILGISRLGANEPTIKSRSKQLFRYVHPDKIHDEEVKRRAHNVFQLINQAVDDALKAVSVSAHKEPPKPPLGIKYTVERAGTVVLLHWKPDKSAESFRVFASLPGLNRSAIDQGTVANITADNGELEYAISAQSRAGNDELFRKGRFEVSISAVNTAGESACMTISVDVTRPSSLGGLKRHHTIC